MDIPQFIYSPTDRGLSFCIYILSSVTSAAMNICVQVFEHLHSILWHIYLGLEFQGFSW